jgi:D-alanyl-D-alanine carboxypeptidase
VVEDAIKAIVTRSANDVAVVIAEALGGDEDSFAQLMTRKARALGMAHTVYINASGLPDDDQITTARDQALLGRAIQDHFPQYYGYFSTSSFRYRGSMIGNHNRLLNQVAGVDGIKTGYIRASGFNLVTSVRRGGRQLVAVVLGGRTAGLRDARMRELIEDYIVVASNKRTAPMIAEAAIEPAPPRRTPMQRIAAAVITPAKADTAPTTATIPSPVPATGPTAALGSTDPLLPLLVKTVAVRPGTIKTASLGPLSATESNAHAVLPVRTVAEPQPEASLPLPAPTPGTHGISPAKLAAAAPPPAPVLEPAPPAPSSAARAGWMIQVGAFDQETEAKQRLNSAQSRAKTLLGAADPFTERVTKGDKTLYRARFAGLDKDRAEAACQYLKKNEIACMALKN